MIKKYSILVLGLVFSFASESVSAQEEEHEVFSILRKRDLSPDTQYTIVNLMLRIDPDLVHAKSKENLTPLHVAAARSLAIISQLLIDKGADVNAIDEDQMTPLHFGARASSDDIVSLLITRGASVNAKNNEGVTPLHIACIGQPFSIIDKTAPLLNSLLRLGADIEAGTTTNTTPLHVAAMANKEKAVRILFLAGAYVDQENSDQHTPFHVALLSHLSADSWMRNKDEVLRALLECGVPLAHDKEMAELEKDPQLYEAVRQLVEKVRKFWRVHIPALEDHYLGEDYEHLHLPDDLRALLLDFIATTALPAKHFHELEEPVSAREPEMTQQEMQQDHNLELEPAHDDASDESLFEQDAAEIQGIAQTSADRAEAEGEGRDAESFARDNSCGLVTSCRIL